MDISLIFLYSMKNITVENGSGAVTLQLCPQRRLEPDALDTPA
jgi:hypothetical protein